MSSAASILLLPLKTGFDSAQILIPFLCILESKLSRQKSNQLAALDQFESMQLVFHHINLKSVLGRRVSDNTRIRGWYSQSSTTSQLN